MTLDDFISTHGLPEHYAESARQHYLPFANWVYDRIRESDRDTFVLGINGAQGFKARGGFRNDEIDTWLTGFQHSGYEGRLYQRCVAGGDENVLTAAVDNRRLNSGQGTAGVRLIGDDGGVAVRQLLRLVGHDVNFIEEPLEGVKDMIDHRFVGQGNQRFFASAEA